MSFEHSKTALNGDVVVQKMVQKIIEENNIETVIETGTHIGHSTYFFSKLVKNVVTTEINEAWLNQAKSYLKDLTNIKFCLGDSATILKEELAKLSNGKVLLFLDAHFYNDLALDRELKAISESKIIPYIMIHDFQVPNRPNRTGLGYDKWDGKVYNLQNIEQMIKDIYPKGYNYYYNHESANGQRGCIFIEPSKNPQRKVIYTAMFGQFDDVHDPIVELPGWDMFFFTDSKLKSNKWNIINAPRIDGFDGVKTSRHYKMFPHLYLKNYDISLWIDASILISKSIDEFVGFITKDIKMGIYQHTKNWKEEFDVMYRWCKDMNILKAQLLDYQNDGFDINKKIMSGNVILREHGDEKVIQAMQLWWEQFNKYYIQRDQISLAYSIWKSNLGVNFFNGLHPRGNRNPYFNNFEHKRTNRVK